MREVIEELIKSGCLKTETIIDAFQKIDRLNFVPDDVRDESYLNIPLPIGHGQTISQPLTVAFMLELLRPEPGNKILEIGSGSGWQTALLSHIVSGGYDCEERDKCRNGKVYAVELIPELEEFGRKNTAKYNFVDRKIAEFHCFNAVNGLPEKAPFDRIISAASCEEIPSAWKKQLRAGGRMVVPVGSSIHLLTKMPDEQFVETSYPGFSFVPFVDK